VPVFGSILYLALGINRIRRRAILLGVHKTIVRPIPEHLGEPQPSGVEHLKMLARVVGRVVAHPLMPGNQIQPLLNGDEAFPAMLATIESASRSISLTTYIFDNDPSGTQFVRALGRAVGRGVEVRVLIDAAGTRYSWPSITHKLKRARIPFAKFLPASLLAPWRLASLNLRNHRKILVVDGQKAFTGGMNIRYGNVLADKPKSPVRDLHFRAEGPVVARLQEAFANDWAFTTGEALEGGIWFPELKECGNVIARVITDGPDADYGKLRWTLLAALAEAQTSVKIITPYFLPDYALVTALNLAALRGVSVDIILPGKSNLPFVHWASRAMWWQVLERGCRIWLTPPPFDHSKLMIVDSHWTLFGSANWDTRSLRLNFELNVESYGRDFADEMGRIIENKLRGAREVTLAEVDGRSYPAKLRDSIARLFSPYL
jgi:cardiolipin synthase A/B